VRKNFKPLYVAGLACAVIFTAVTAHAKDITIAFVGNSMQYPYDVAVAKGFQDVCKKLDCKTSVLDAKGSVEKEGNAIDDLIAQNVDGIAFIPQDSAVARSWVDKAAEHHIPIVAVATQVGDPDKVPLRQVYSKLTALVTTDDVLAGEHSGELAAKTLPRDRVAKIAIVEGSPGMSIVRQRTEGFRKALDKAGIKYQIVASQPTDWTADKGEAVCQNMLTAHPDVDVIFSQADDMALGCARAIREAGSKATLIATAGGSRLGNAAISNGELAGSVCTRPELIGRLTANALYDAVTGKNAKKAQFITYDIPAITKANLSVCPAEW